MASRLNPYISFPGNAREAMEFYERVLGGTLTVHTFGEFGSQDSPHADKIMHSMLETDRGFTLMGADTAPGMVAVELLYDGAAPGEAGDMRGAEG